MGIGVKLSYVEVALGIVLRPLICTKPRLYPFQEGPGGKCCRVCSQMIHLTCLILLLKDKADDKQMNGYYYDPLQLIDNRILD